MYSVFLPFSAKEVISGMSQDFVNSKTVNNRFLLLKNHIYKLRCKNISNTQNGGIEFLKYWITVS